MREKIIQTSIYLFDKKGYSETSIQDIVENIGVTKGTFYYYFKSKQELLRVINLSYIEGILQKQEIILKDLTKNYSEKLYDIIYMVISAIKSQRESARIFSREMRHIHDSDFELVKAKRDKFRKNYQLMIEEAIAKGEFNNNVRADILTFGILGITNWSYYWYDPDGEVSEEELANFYMELILNGIGNLEN
ncbi:TetR/AcrR family transcriptional regulator [Oceanobacillus senegalensis]|uniref:TetR/AcrR family transcriptional regulator n=1 Tax=Oceanobacillus senegalensis TaxID=1936063 RepID=UPI000A30C83C|nr:TetR/AcrR family transcriptional regulator [Oceanobacillus senegalensis]